MTHTLETVNVEVFHAGQLTDVGTVPTGFACVQFSDPRGIFQYTAPVATVRRMLEFARRELDA